MKVYVLFNNLMDCYDCPDEFEGVYSTKDEAEKEILKRSKQDQKYFYVEEHEI